MNNTSVNAGNARAGQESVEIYHIGTTRCVLPGCFVCGGQERILTAMIFNVKNVETGKRVIDMFGDCGSDCEKDQKEAHLWQGGFPLP